ncbi:hypothetical protein RRG08_013700 [Elysia crispata]|uniref:Uncharacterized protein n=1 Tax=Elysia crispata TaxID=231223 RepID=A0AAE1DIN8_9GAST|nr:hypothetical protein RRG08_013700 [Elysia crispata]
MNNETSAKTEDEEFPNVYEKWLRTRLNYAVMAETRQPANPGFIDAVVTAGTCKHHTQNELRKELWVENRYPHSDYFGDRVVAYSFPRHVTEILDMRFSRNPLNKPIDGLKSSYLNPVYDISLRELATIPTWGAPPSAAQHQVSVKQSDAAPSVPPSYPNDLSLTPPLEQMSSTSAPPEQMSITPAECLHLLPKFKLAALRRARAVKRRR